MIFKTFKAFPRCYWHPVGCCFKNILFIYRIKKSGPQKSLSLISYIWYEGIGCLTDCWSQRCLVRFPNCHECQLGFQYPKKLEIGKQWPVVEKKYISVVTKLGKLSTSVSQAKMSAKNSQNFMVSRLEDQTCPPWIHAILISAGGIGSLLAGGFTCAGILF